MYVFIVTHQPDVNGFCQWLIEKSSLELDGKVFADHGVSSGGMTDLSSLRADIVDTVANDLAGVPSAEIEVADFTEDSLEFLHAADAVAGQVAKARCEPYEDWLKRTAI